MLRVVLILGLLLTFGQASGAVWFGADTCSEDDCGDASTGKACPPNCPTCTCALTIQTLAATRVVVDLDPPRTVSELAMFSTETSFTTPDPREILHVPKLVV